jgi:hypothetical protein
MVAFESVARVLHFLHLVAGVVTLASATHLLVRTRKNKRDPRIRLHTLTLLLAYVSTYVLGALIYPTFRVRVRAEILDPSYPWATGLFEIKEHAASLLLLPVVAIFVLARVVDAGAEADRRYLSLLRGLAGVVLCAVVYNACVGWYLGTIRSV